MAEKRVAILKRANKLFRQGKADAAVKEYKKILEIKPDDLEVRRIVGDLELRQNNVKEAAEQFEWIADYYLKEGFFAKAIAMYKRITRIDPSFERALFKLADLYTKQGLVMEAKQIFLDIAEECKRQGNQKKALSMYKKILEFDRSNIKMRLLLADNYLKEGLKDEALTEYMTAADIVLNKKDYRRAEELLLNTAEKIKDIKVTEKLIQLYIKEGEDDKAIRLINSQGMTMFKDAEMLKTLGELYLKKNMITDAEKIFSKVAEINPEETEVIIRLGKVYLQREDYDRTFQLFLPLIDRDINQNKFDEASNLLRFVIASNNSHLPSLLKLAEIFRLSGKTNNLIALYESMIPIYEERGMTGELRSLLEELIQLSDTPFGYQEQLAKLSGQQAREAEEAEEEKESAREKEFVNHNLRVVEEAMKIGDIAKAVETLKKSKNSFPKNVSLREKLFEVYLESGQTELAVEEGKGLLELYKFLSLHEEYTDLLEKLSTLKPEDDKLVALSGEEKTNIEIDFDAAELDEQFREIGTSDMHDDVADVTELGDDVLVLSDSENVGSIPVPRGGDVSKSLSSILSEVDFYVNDGYFGDAEKLIEQLKQKYPGNKQLLAKIEKLEQAKRGIKQDDESSSTGIGLDFEIERNEAGTLKPKLDTGRGGKPGERELTERIGRARAMGSYGQDEQEMIHHGADSNIEINLNMDDLKAKSSSGIKFTDDNFSDLDIPDQIPVDLDVPVEPVIDDMELEPAQAPEPDHEPEEESGMVLEFGPGQELELDQVLESESQPEPELEPELEAEAAADSEEVFELDPSMSADNILVPTMPEMLYTPPGKSPGPRPAEPKSEPETISGDIFEIESSIAEESSMAQEYEDSKVDLKIADQDLIKPPVIKPKEAGPEDEDLDLQIDLEEPADTDNVPLAKVDEDLLIQSPSTSPGAGARARADHSSSAIEELDLDSIMITKDENSVYDLDAPFREMSSPDVAFDSGEGEELLAEGDHLPEEMAYFEIENNVQVEMEAIVNWLKELEKQRTSTIEKNMMEIFEEFKKGVDEKIGQEDYDTRYNLGIAYKEMGLLEEAIHEFLISSKHPLKFFDSAGLLGMCFREKGLFGEASTWFEKALKAPDRRKEEYMAIQFELVITLKLKEDYLRALKISGEILKADPNYRDVKTLYQELKNLVNK
jgi:tetratricopeptide (TPR) repeat protein